MKIKASLLFILAIPLVLGAVLTPPSQRALTRLIPGAQHNLDIALFRAARDGSTRQIQILLARGADPNQPIYQGDTTWHVAAIAWPERSEKLFKALQGYPVPWSAKNDLGQSVFAVLCESRSEASAVPLDARLKWALESGANPNTTTEKGVPVLHLVAMFPSGEGVRQLLRFGAQPDKTDAHGQTALLCVLKSYGTFDSLPCSGYEECERGTLNGKEVVHLLLKAGANPLQRSHLKQTPLEYARTQKATRQFVPLLQHFASKHR